MTGVTWLSDTTWSELFLLILAFLLSATIGLERHRKLKSAGLRTHTLVGVGSALFTLVSTYGFTGVASEDVIVDPTRVAAQIVSGIGFLGAGVIFVRRGTVAGLTTAASIWMTAAIGMACGAGAPLLAIMATGVQLLAVTVLGPLGRLLRREPPTCTLTLRYTAGDGSLRRALTMAADQGITAVVRGTARIAREGKPPRVRAIVELQESASGAARLIESISDMPGVRVRVLETADAD